MTNFNDMLQKAKQMQQKMKEAQDEIKNIQVEGVSGGNLVKVIFEEPQIKQDQKYYN